MGNRPSGASRHGGVSIGLSAFFRGGGVGRVYTVCEMNTHACVKFSLRPKKTADLKSSFIRTRFSV